MIEATVIFLEYLCNAALILTNTFLGQKPGLWKDWRHIASASQALDILRRN